MNHPPKNTVLTLFAVLGFFTTYPPIFPAASADPHARACSQEDPTHYLPSWGGFCSYGVAHEIVWNAANLGPASNPDYWLILDDVLYLFRRCVFVGVVSPSGWWNRRKCWSVRLLCRLHRHNHNHHLHHTLVDIAKSREYGVEVMND